MTWRMRKAFDKWSSDKNTDSPFYKKAKQSFLEELWRHECEAAEADGILKALKENSYARHRTEKTNMHMVTLNFTEEATQKLPDILETTQKWSQQKHIKEIEYVFEQRSETVETMGQGMHVHAIVTTDTNKADLIKRTFNTFKQHLGDKSKVDVRPISPELLASKKAYIRGEKKGDEKKRKVIIDKLWRAKYCLEPIYIKNALCEKESLDTQALHSTSSSEANDVSSDYDTSEY